MYEMTNSGNLFADELTNWMIDESGFKQSKLQMYVYFKYATDDYRLVVLSYVDDCVYWYISEELGEYSYEGKSLCYYRGNSIEVLFA